MASVLVSEADPDVRRLLVLVIERLGHQALVLGSDVEVPPCPHLLLLEPSSPACLEEARRVRTLCPDLKVVAMSAFPDDVAPFADGGGPIEYLEKPFTIDALVATLVR